MARKNLDRLDRLLEFADRTEALAQHVERTIVPQDEEREAVNKEEMQLLMLYLNSLRSMTEEQFRTQHPAEYDTIEHLLYSDEEYMLRHPQPTGLRLVGRASLRRSA